MLAAKVPVDRGRERRPRWRRQWRRRRRRRRGSIGVSWRGGRARVGTNGWNDYRAERILSSPSPRFEQMNCLMRINCVRAKTEPPNWHLCPASFSLQRRRRHSRGIPGSRRATRNKLLSREINVTSEVFSLLSESVGSVAAAMKGREGQEQINGLYFLFF